MSRKSDPNEYYIVGGVLALQPIFSLDELAEFSGVKKDIARDYLNGPAREAFLELTGSSSKDRYMLLMRDIFEPTAEMFAIRLWRKFVCLYEDLPKPIFTNMPKVPTILIFGERLMYEEMHSARSTEAEKVFDWIDRTLGYVEDYNKALPVELEQLRRNIKPRAQQLLPYLEYRRKMLEKALELGRESLAINRKIDEFRNRTDLTLEDIDAFKGIAPASLLAIAGMECIGTGISPRDAQSADDKRMEETHEQVLVDMEDCISISDLMAISIAISQGEEIFEEIRQHIDSCDHCRATMAGLRPTKE